jgi:hypothetical protein
MPSQAYTWTLCEGKIVLIHVKETYWEVEVELHEILI